MFDASKLTRENLGTYLEGGKNFYVLMYWTPECIREGLEKVKKYKFRSYIGPNENIANAKKELEGTGIKVLSTFSFPSGNVCMETKKAELGYIIDQGADTCDGCLNMTHIKSGQWDLVKKEADEIVKFAKSKNKNAEIKFIFELAFVTDDELLKAAEIIYNSGADFIKTSTGWKKGDIEARQIRLIHDAFPDLKIKGSAYQPASGLSGAIEFLDAGATCLGTSNIEKMLSDWDYFSMLNK
jgi:deoxyribose-phosphate aldolase